MTYTATKIEAPAEHAWWELPVAWVRVFDEDGNSIVCAVMSGGKLTDERGYSLGDQQDPEVIAITEAAAKALSA